MGSGSHSSKRKKKRSQKRSKKRHRSSKEKTKKRNRRHDSVSCSDEDLASTSSILSSSFDDDHKRKRRGRSQDRRSRKGSKRRSKRSSSMSESSRDSPRAKKPKRSKTKKYSDLKKKSSRKRRKREPSITCSSGRSKSRSTHEPSNDSERELHRNEEKLETKEMKGRETGMKRSGSKRSRHRSRSCSPCSLHRESHSYHSEDRVMEENNPKRLKSVIVAISEREEVELGVSTGDAHEDEIVYEHDDYPSRSNDSNDGVSRKEGIQYSHDDNYEEIKSLENSNREVVASDVRTSELSGIQRLVVEKTGETTSSNAGNGGQNRDDLEAILRQKALENLLKRRGELATTISADKKGELNSEVKKSSSLMIDEEESIRSVQKVVKIGDEKYANKPTGSPKGNNVHPSSWKLGHPVEKSNVPGDLVIGRPKVGLPTSRKQFLGANNTWKRELNLKEHSQPKLSKPIETTNKDSAESSGKPSLDSKVSTEKVDDFVPSEPFASGGQSSNDKTNEVNEDSQFQQKTMSVMRGGEMVQVSYKVYIPKKAPALARRQLRR